MNFARGTGTRILYRTVNSSIQGGSIRNFHLTKPNNGILDGLSSWLAKVGKKTTIGAATALFNNCQLQASHQAWNSHGLIGGDFRSKHMLLVLHVWMVHKRLLPEGKQGLLVQEALFDELWEDTCNRIRGQGVVELSVNKYLKEVQSYSFRCCVELDKALDQLNSKIENGNADTKVILKSDDNQFEYNSLEEKVLDDIGGVLWRLVYLKREEIEVDHVLELAKYLRREQESLFALPREAIFEGRFAWGPVPTWGKAGGVKKVASQAEFWREATAPDGRVYYWNTVTRESRWEKPKELETDNK